MDEMTLLMQVSGWIVAFLTTIWATWATFSAKKKDDLLIDVKNALEDNQIETAEVVDFVRKWIQTKQQT